MYFLGNLPKPQLSRLLVLADRRGTSVHTLAGVIIGAYLAGRLVYKKDAPAVVKFPASRLPGASNHE